uniref:Uncharacterized protein n=1 Tax=Parascaris equorum TaxID=6256 RepID=A0A914RFG8_PAREQ
MPCCSEPGLFTFSASHTVSSNDCSAAPNTSKPADISIIERLTRSTV